MVQQDTDQGKRFKVRHALLGLLLILLVWFAFFRVGAYRDVSKRVEELRAQGYPMSLEALEQSYRLPVGADNAADNYMTAFSHRVEWDSDARDGLPWIGTRQAPTRVETLDPEIRTRVEQLLADNEQTLSLLHEAVAFAHCRYPVDFSEGVDVDTDWLPDVRKSAFLLSLETLVACERDDPNQAMRSVHANLALARSMNAPILIHRLVRIAVEALAYGNIERVVNRMRLGDERLQRLSGWLEEPDDDEGRRQAFIGERCSGLAVFRGAYGQLAGHEGVGGKLMRLLVGFRKVLGLHDQDMLGYINVLQGHIDRAAFAAQEEVAGHGLVACVPRGDPRGGFLTSLLSPAFTRVFELEVRKIAGRRTAQTALAIERYRLAEGRLPRVLSDLVPTYLAGVPKDPFDGHDLRYGVRARGYVVYSIGEDRRDDGGTERSERKRDEQGQTIRDVTFIVER